MMYMLAVVFAVLNLLLAVLAAPLPLGQSPTKRQNTGRGTWFYDQTNESACNSWNTDNDLIVAVSAAIFGNGGLCGTNVWISSNGVTASARIEDECESCGPGDLDMSIGLFLQFATLDVGELSISWGQE